MADDYTVQTSKFCFQVKGILETVAGRIGRDSVYKINPQDHSNCVTPAQSKVYNRREESPLRSSTPCC